MQVCRTPLALPAAPQPPAMQAGRQRGGHIALREVAMRSFQPDEEFFFSDVPGVASLLERDRKTIDLNEDALAAFVDEPAVLRGISGKNAEITSAEHKDEEELEEQQGLAGKRDDKLKDASSTPKRAREAINQGLQKFQQKNYRGGNRFVPVGPRGNGEHNGGPSMAVLPGSGFMRLSGSVKEYSCASEGEENAALYNMCCAWAALGEKQVRDVLAAGSIWWPAPVVQAVVDQVTSWGYRAVAVSVVSGEGLEQLMEALQRRVTVVAGPSGAGKSSIINALRMRSRGLESTLGAMAAEPSGTPAESSKEEEGARAEYSGSMQQQSQGAAEEQWRRQDVTQPPPVNKQQQQQQDVGRACSSLRMPADLELQAVGQVSQRIGRGKHTTRNVTLLELEDGSSGSGSDSGSSSGLVVDTPGFNQPDLAGMPATELWQHFPEIRQLLEEDRCTFRGCQHLQEPGCVVREAGWERYPLYCEIHAELKALEEQAATRQTGKKRREGSVRMKSRVGGQQGEEARLETKSHRRISRRSVRQKLSDLVKDVQEDEQF